jgi:hypothetical protein
VHQRRETDDRRADTAGGEGDDGILCIDSGAALHGVILGGEPVGNASYERQRKGGRCGDQRLA